MFGTPRKYYGKLKAVVVDNAPEDAEVPGAIKVRIDRFLELEPGSTTSVKPRECVANPCLPPGAFIIPAVDAGVWVEFLDGDLRSPIWTGVHYQPEAAPATPEGGQPGPDHRLLRSVSGHVLCFDDTSGSERIVLQDPNKNVLTMSKDGVQINCGDSVSLTLTSSAIELACGAGNSLTLDSRGLAYNGKLLLLDALIPLLVAHKNPPNAVAPDLATLPMDTTIVSKKS